MLELLLCAAGVALTTPPDKPPAAPAAATEMLEFLADWHDDEAQQFLDPHKHKDNSLPALGPTRHQAKDSGHEH